MPTTPATPSGVTEADAQYMAHGGGPAPSGGDVAYVLSGNEQIREARTMLLNLTEGDVIYFMVSCKQFRK